MWYFICDLKFKYIFFFNFLFLISSDLRADESFTFKKIISEKIFYNIILIDDEIYIGSNKGVYIIDKLNEDLSLVKNSIIGPVNSNLEYDESHRIEFISPPRDLTEKYNFSVTDYLYNGNKLYVISKGDLLIFEAHPYKFNAVGSVRSITKNSLGTYSGVYINENKLEVKYTDGQIREFDSISFVCYNGLISYKNGVEKILYNNSNAKINNDATYGRISDIFHIGEHNYILISGDKLSSLNGDNGIYKYNYKSNNFEFVYTSEKNVIPVKNKIYNRIKNSKEFHFIDNDNYYSLDLIDFSVSLIHRAISTKIIDILEDSVDGTIFFAITENNKLLKLEIDYDGLKVIKSIRMNNSAHTITDMGEILFISGNNGLSFFDKNSEKIFDNIIIDEFNKGAFYKSGDNVSFGSIHGIYEFENVSKFKTTNFINNYLEPKKDQNLLLYFFIFVSISSIFITFALRKKRNVSNEEVISNIKIYIEKNLKNVTLDLIQDKFGLDYYELNSLNKNFKPAKHIKREREKTANKMFLNGESFENIASKTGYSVSYLIKYKNKFTRVKP